MLIDKKRKFYQKVNSMKKILILFVLFITLTGVFINFNHKNQSETDKKIEKIHYSNYSDNIIFSNIERKIFRNEEQNRNRVLDDYQINTWTNDEQSGAKLLTLSNGNFVCMWESKFQKGDCYNIYGQIFYSNGAKKGNEFLVNNYNGINHFGPNIAASSTGKFMVL